MILPRIPRLDGAAEALVSWGSSSALHVAVIAALALTTSHQQQAELEAPRGKVSLEVTFDAAADQTDQQTDAVAEYPVIVEPWRARIAERRFSHVPHTPPAPSAIGHGPMVSDPRPVEVEPVSRPPEAEPARVAADVPLAPARPPKPLAAAIPSAVSPPGDESESAPRFVNNAPPTYPREAFTRNLEGTVTLRLTVASSGRVTDVEVRKSSGHLILDAAAVNAVRKWHGEPARRGGRPVKVRLIQEVQFVLP